MRTEDMANVPRQFWGAQQRSAPYKDTHPRSCANEGRDNAALCD